MDRQKLAELFKATAALDTPEGVEAYKAFAQALTVPILQEIKDASIMRQLFAVERLAPGARLFTQSRTTSRSQYSYCLVSDISLRTSSKA